MSIPPNYQVHFSWVGIALSMLLLPTAGEQMPAVAAERIYGSYAPLERSISIAALETYAKEGKLDDDLAVYAQYINPQQLARLRSVLLTRIELSPVALSQFLYTPIGETLLERLGQVIQTDPVNRVSMPYDRRLFLTPLLQKALRGFLFWVSFLLAVFGLI